MYVYQCEQLIVLLIVTQLLYIGTTVLNYHKAYVLLDVLPLLVQP
jgi:hypothetical protein